MMEILFVTRNVDLTYTQLGCGLIVCFTNSRARNNSNNLKTLVLCYSETIDLFSILCSCGELCRNDGFNERLK